MLKTIDGGGMIKIAIPNKGRMYEPTKEMLAQAGIRFSGGERKLVCRTTSKNVEIMLVRTEDIPKYVEIGAADAGFTGSDLVVESKANVSIVTMLNYGACRVVLAVPEGSRIKSVKDLQNKRVATKLVNIAGEFFKNNRINAKMFEVSGAVEITPLLGVADAIIDHVDTGATLSANRLVEIVTLLDSKACLIANKNSLVEKKKEIEEVKLSLQGIIGAENMKYLMVNAPSDEILKEVVRILPALESPTVLKLAKQGKYAVHAVVSEQALAGVVRRLKEAGGKDILVLNLEKVIP